MKAKQFGMVALIAGGLVELLYLRTASSPYAVWTPMGSFFLFGVAFFAVTTIYVLGRVALSALLSLRGKRAVTTAVFLACATTTAFGATCYDTYQSAALTAYNELESCIVGTNNDSAGTRLAIRAVCNAKYISDAEEAAINYAGCMSLSALLPFLN